MFFSRVGFNPARVAVCGVLCLSVAVFGQPGGGPPLFSVQVTPAIEKEIAASLEFTGSINPWREIALSSQVGGLVERIPIEAGDFLEGGREVCFLNTEAAEIEVRRQQALVAAASAEYSRLAAGFRREEIEETRKKVEMDRARFKRAEDEWNRRRPLVEQGVITQSEGITLEMAFMELEAALHSSEARLRLLEAGYRKEEVAAAKAKHEMQRAELAEAERKLKEHTISTPMLAAVVSRLVEPGEWVKEGDSVASLVVLDPLRVRIEIPQVFFSKVSQGQEATIEVDGLPERRFTATVDHVVPGAGAGTRNFPVLMKLDNTDGALMSGLFARVRLKLGEKAPAVLVPRQAVLVRGESTVVLVAEPLKAAPPSPAQSDRSPSDTTQTKPSGGGNPAQAGPPGAGGPPGMPAPMPDATIREVTVRTGGEEGDWVAVEVIGAEPIRAGELIVSLGGIRLQNGMPVRILNRETSTAEAPAANPPAESVR
ncbi:MAG: efflux RND transporter periplasmic adaptor subunit [Candidatus Omnitrophica bacterium]|nr:hypothetical protein [bacterium]NUN96478.1 efflux RND transporter periplasmic adaptor subunit [Candidatus Omnitrophota bacterium]